MAQSIAEDGVVNRLKLVPFGLLQAGPFLWPIAVAGLWWLCRAPAARPWRPIGYGYLVILAVLLASGGKYYYALGFVPVLVAAGAVPLDGWLRTAVRRRAFAVAVVASGALMIVGTLPVLPPAILARTPLPALYAESADQVGWPELVHAVERAVSALPPDERGAGRDPDRQLRPGGRPRRARLARPAAGRLGPQRVRGVGAAAR